MERRLKEWRVLLANTEETHEEEERDGRNKRLERPAKGVHCRCEVCAAARGRSRWLHRRAESCERAQFGQERGDLPSVVMVGATKCTGLTLESQWNSV